MKYSPSDYAQILYETGDVNAFVKLLEKHWVLPWLPKILERFEKLYRKEEGVVEVRVKSAYPLGGKTQHYIEEIVKKEQKGKILQFDFALDKGLIGGFRVESEEIIVPASLMDTLVEIGKRL